LAFAAMIPRLMLQRYPVGVGVHIDVRHCVTIAD
jgi:hypothetical protein